MRRKRPAESAVTSIQVANLADRVADLEALTARVDNLQRRIELLERAIWTASKAFRPPLPFDHDH